MRPSWGVCTALTALSALVAAPPPAPEASGWAKAVGEASPSSAEDGAAAGEGPRSPSPGQPCTVPHPTDPTHLLEGADLHYKLVRFYEGTGPPPLEEVFFTTQNMSVATQEALLRECPGLLLSAFLALAEARLPVAPEEASNAVAKADLLASRLSVEDYEATCEVWPVLPALASYRRALASVGPGLATGGSLAQTREGTSSVHVVVCHCGESLDWLSDGHFYLPDKDAVLVDLFVYEKCSRTPDNMPALSQRFRRVSLTTVEDGDVRRDECSAYLRHLVEHYEDAADYNLFFQADAGDHMQWGYLHLVLRAIEHGALQAPFVHLNHPRLVASLSPCREEVFGRIFDRPPGPMLGAYCCAQFAVSRQRVQANPRERYERMQRMLFEESPDECHDIPGHSTHCLMFEVYWHVLFGEPDELPAREDNDALPLLLRTRDIENESYLPPGSLYLQLATDAVLAEG